MAFQNRIEVQVDDEDALRGSGGGVAHSSFFEKQRAQLLLQAAEGSLPKLVIDRSLLSSAIAAAGGATGLEDVNEKFRRELEEQRETLLEARRAVRGLTFTAAPASRKEAFHTCCLYPYIRFAGCPRSGSVR